MRECFCVFLLMLHFTEGCQLSGYRESKVTGYTGGSVLLPCSCTDPQSTVKFTWLVLHGSQRNEVFKNENYKGRWKLFNESSPANLSLLISDLRKEDEGSYRCEILGRNYTDIRVNIKGCDLDQNKQTVEVTGHSGESVVLPCSCTELQDKPLQLTWTYTPLNQTKSEEIYPNEQSERHRGRVKLLDQPSPGNLSLLISGLNTEDQGEYHCSVLQQQHVNIRLRVQEELYFQSICLSIHKPAKEESTSTQHSGDISRKQPHNSP
ncbi:polymeric immunoglobulin receptor-like [Chanodichthys erythropterus]|uniref:polymeric immunoglobulin receptor-like n=1 Tax=Chanodichthys erythropterus TaxID=933992 RepID=UPI00351E60BC